jgi:hypothetical protein
MEELGREASVDGVTGTTTYKNNFSCSTIDTVMVREANFERRRYAVISGHFMKPCVLMSEIRMGV